MLGTPQFEKKEIFDLEWNFITNQSQSLAIHVSDIFPGVVSFRSVSILYQVQSQPNHATVPVTSKKKGVVMIVNSWNSGTLLKKRLLHRYFPVNFTNILRTFIL